MDGPYLTERSHNTKRNRVIGVQITRIGHLNPKPIFNPLLLNDVNVDDFGGLQRLIETVCLQAFNFRDNIHPFGDTPEYGVLVVEPLGGLRCDEKLRSVETQIVGLVSAIVRVC